MALQDVKFLRGEYARIRAAAAEKTNAVLVATDKPVAALGGNLFYGQPTITYANEKITLWGYKNATADNEKLGEIDLTLDSFLEKAKYFDKEVSMADIATWVNIGSIGVADVLAAYKEAFGVAGDLPEEHSAIVMVMHGEHASGDTHSLVVIPIGKLMGDVQTEVDAIETAVGLESGGTYAPISSGVAQGATTVKGAVEAINTNLGTKSAGSTTVAAETVWAAIEEVAAEKTVVKGNDANKNLTVTSADTDGKVTYTVNETGLTPADGVAISSSNTVAANLGELDTKIGAFTASPEYASAFTASSANAIATTDTVATGLAKLDNKVKALVDEVLDNEETTANAIAAVADASGIKGTDGNIAYQVHTTDSILSSATTLDSADVALANAIRELQATAGALEGENAIVVTKTAGQATKVSLKLKDANTTGVTEATGGIQLTNDGNGLGATLYWGSF